VTQKRKENNFWTMKNDDLQVSQKYIPPFLEGASSRSVMKNSISTSTVTPEVLELTHGNIVKRANACSDANGQNFENLF
jgi:hypothetical protein